MENQVLEWKETWHDEYLKWICGFANAHGGTLVIGKNDNGEIIGITDAKKLLENLPNKIRSTMGIVVDINLKSEDALDFIEINVPSHPNAISYRGKYYLRSGSTNQELSGYALDAMLLEKYGRTHDAKPLPHVSIGDFWHDAFDLFRKKAVASKRLAEEDVAISDEELLHALNLTENGYLLLAAILAFHQTPQRWCIGAYIKIGYFADDTEILYQDELNGALVGMADKVMEIIFTKYFIGHIHYTGLQRIDNYPMPRAALREAVMNALVHRDYSTGSPIQIRVYNDRVTIANDCRLPEGTTLSKLVSAHKSVSINPLIAGVMFRSGQIEAWGRGIERIIKLCIEDKLPEPEFIITQRTFTISFHIRDNRHVEETAKLPDEPINEKQKQIVDLINLNPKITVNEMVDMIGLSQRTIKYAIQSLKRSGILERIGARRNGYWKVSANITHPLDEFLSDDVTRNAI
ncbi:MAG: putative DNA binding domain-containing protein [Bacteroidales bacterium]|nr:putative DNA binding domain-containing protein [Bacteroidales bacterium]